MVGSLYLVLSFAFLVSGAPIEQQMKFLYPDDKVLMQFDGYSTIHHDTFQVVDVYLDTVDKSLYKSGFSLRVRRAIKAGKEVFLLQFKSEMQDQAGVRLEYDIAGLNEFETGGPELGRILRQLAQKETPCQSELSRVAFHVNSREWGFLPPLQKAREMTRGQSLEVLSVGYSERQRYHIGFEKGQEWGVLSYLPENKKILNQDFTWLFELSKDRSNFYLVRRGCEKVVVREIEIENKFRPRKWGQLVLNHFVETRVNGKGWKPHLASKYAQVIAKEKP